LCIFDQAVQGALRQFGISVIGGSKKRERARVFQHLDETSVLNDGAACNVSMRSAMSDFSFISTVILSSSAVEVNVCTRLTDQSVLIFSTRQYNIGGCELSCPKRGILPRSHPWTALVPKSHRPALIIHHAIMRRLSTAH